MSSSYRQSQLDESLAAYVTQAKKEIFHLFVNVIMEIERLELTIAQQCASIEAAQQAITDLELSMMDEVGRETTAGVKRATVMKYPHDWQRKYQVRNRLSRNNTYSSLRESERGMTREKARLTARLHKLEAYREMLLIDASSRSPRTAKDN